MEAQSRRGTRGGVLGASVGQEGWAYSGLKGWGFDGIPSMHSDRGKDVLLPSTVTVTTFVCVRRVHRGATHCSNKNGSWQASNHLGYFSLLLCFDCVFVAGDRLHRTRYW